MLETCERDTADFVGQGAANRLARWRRYERNDDLVLFIEERIMSENGPRNGWEIHRNNGVSLESIVLAIPELFDETVRMRARELLGIES